MRFIGVSQTGFDSGGGQTSVNISYPTGWQAGDLLILVAAIRNQNPATPSGFTVIRAPANGGDSTVGTPGVFGRYALSGDSTTVSVTFPSAFNGAVALVAYRHVGSSLSSLATNRTSSTGSGSSLSALSVTGANHGRGLSIVTSNSGNNGNHPTYTNGSYTERADSPSGGRMSVGVYETDLVAGSNSISGTTQSFSVSWGQVAIPLVGELSLGIAEVSGYDAAPPLSTGTIDVAGLDARSPIFAALATVDVSGYPAIRGVGTLPATIEIVGFSARPIPRVDIALAIVRGLSATPASGGTYDPPTSGGTYDPPETSAKPEPALITASVWERDVVTPAQPVFICELPDSFGRSWRRHISEPGTGELSVQMNDPARAELTEGRIVRFYRSGNHETGTLEFAFLIGPQDRALVAPGEEHDEVCTVAGPGMLAALGEAIVVPDRTLDIASHSNVKRYDHSSNAYNLVLGAGRGGRQYGVRILEDHTWTPEYEWTVAEDGFPPPGADAEHLPGIWTGWVNLFEDGTWTEAGGWDVADGFIPMPPDVGNGGTQPISVNQDYTWTPIGWNVEDFDQDEIDAGIFNDWIRVLPSGKWHPNGFMWTVEEHGWLPIIPVSAGGIDGEWGYAVVTPETYYNLVGGLVENFGAPSPWSIPEAGKWIWSIDSNATVPAGDCYFYNKFTLASDMLVGFEVAYDDIGWTAIDNEIIDGLVQEEFYTGQGRSAMIPLKAGTHIIAAKVTNLNSAKAGLKLAAYEIVNGELETLLFESDDSWKVMGYPDSPPGFAVGEIIREEFASGYLRGCFLDVGAEFEDTTDTDEQPFTITSDVTLPIGADVLEVITQLAVTYIDADMTPTMGLKVWNKGMMGSPSGLVLTIGRDIIEYRVIAEPGKRINALLVRYEGGYLMIEDTDLIAASTRCEGFLDLGSIRSVQEATRLARAEITEKNTKKWTISTSVDIPFADRPGLGDTLTGFDFDGNAKTLRVVAETVVSGDDLDDDTWTPELVFVEAEA